MAPKLLKVDQAMFYCSLLLVNSPIEMLHTSKSIITNPTDVHYNVVLSKSVAGKILL